MKNNTWLHSRLSSVAKNCIGIDIDQNSIDYLISKYNISNVVSADITSDKIPEIESHHWDYLVMGEILEHVNNPTSFLEAIKKNYQGIIDRLFITVPNAFYYTNFAKALKNTEIINSDHRYTFTPYTLAKIVHEAGMEVESFYFTHDLDRKIGLRAKLKIFPFIKRRLLYNRMEKNPLLRDTLVMIIKTNS